MAVLVTGGAGYIGGHMVLALLDAGEKVIVLDDLSSGFAWAVPATATLVIGDVGDIDLVSRLIENHAIEAICHFAARVAVPDSIADPLGYYLSNTSKARNLIACAATHGVRNFIFSSTAAVYGESASETVAPRPSTPYGRSKLAVEWMLADAARAHAMRYVAIRYFNVAGADPKGRLGQSAAHTTHLIRRAVQTALGQHPAVEIYGADYPTPDGTCLRDFVHVSDLIDAHLAALTHLRGGGTSLVCNCGYGRGCSVRDVVDTVKRVTGTDFRVEVVDRRPGDLPSVIADPNFIRQKLGWRPRRDLDTIVRDTLDWERRLLDRFPLLQPPSHLF